MIDLLQVNTSQHSKYLTVNINMVKSYQSEKNLLEKMKNFKEISNAKREFKIEKKKMKYLKLEQIVQEKKEEINEIERSIKDTSTKIENQNMITKSIEHKNKVIFNEINSIR